MPSCNFCENFVNTTVLAPTCWECRDKKQRRKISDAYSNADKNVSAVIDRKVPVPVPVPVQTIKDTVALLEDLIEESTEESGLGDVVRMAIIQAELKDWLKNLKEDQ